MTKEKPSTKEIIKQIKNMTRYFKRLDLKKLNHYEIQELKKFVKEIENV